MTPRLDKDPRDNPMDRSPFVPHGRMPGPFTLVIFGATGDLAGRKLFPAVFALVRGQFLPAHFIVDHDSMGRANGVLSTIRDNGMLSCASITFRMVQEHYSRN